MNLKAMVITGDSGKDYTVSLGEHERLHCTCLAFRFADDGYECKHIAFARSIAFGVAH